MRMRPSSCGPAMATRGILLLLLPVITRGNPLSKPFIPFRTDPHEQPVVDHAIDLDSASTSTFRSKIHSHTAMENTHCPLHFVLGVSKRLHGSSQHTSSISRAPVIYPVFAGQGPGRQVVYVTDYEHLDLLTPGTLANMEYHDNSNSNNNNPQKQRSQTMGGVKEILVQAPDFPLLLEGSSFHTSPILHDVNADGRMDAIVADYDGGIFMIGLTTTTTSHNSPSRTRLLQSAQVPRLYIRREWMQGRVNESLGIIPPATMAPHPSAKNNSRPQEHIHDPYHSYFELYSSNAVQNDKNVLRAVTANVLQQEAAQWQALQDRRRRQKHVHVTLEGTMEDNVTLEFVRHNHDAADKTWDDDDTVPKEHSLDDDDLAWQQAKQRREELYEGGGGAGQVYPDRRQKEGLTKLSELADQRHLDPAAEAAGDERAQDHRRLQEQDREEASHDNNSPGDAVPQDALGDHRSFALGDRRNFEQHEPDPAEPSQVLQDHQDHVSENEHAQGLDPPSEHAATTGSDQDHLDGHSNERMQQQELIEHDSARLEAGDQSNIVHEPIDAVKDVDPPVLEQAGLYDDIVDPHQRARDMPYDDYGIDDPSPRREEQHRDPAHDDHDPDYGLHDDYARYGRGHYDDYYRYHNSAHQEYYDSKHYIRISPHVLATPTLAELPKLYSNNDEKDEVLFVPVSYYLDEDEYEGYFSYQRFTEKDHGDETEVDRGRYVASAILSYILGDSPRWTGEQHLDLSSDYTAPQNVSIVGALPERADLTRMGAFAMASPTVADIDGDGKLELIMGTSMGMVYCLDARNLLKKEKWPVQMRFPVESRVLVEDIVGDTHLEIIVSDVGGNIVCFNHEGKKLWHRDLAASVGATSHDVTGMSPMVLGDANGDGKINIVLAITISAHMSYMFVLDASTGSDSTNFPLQLDAPDKPSDSPALFQKLAQPLMVDLSTDHSFVEEYTRRRGVPKRHVLTSTHEAGLHIVYPSGEKLYIIDAGSGCTHPVSLGEVVTAPVQVDDVHGTNKLDLVVATKHGNVVTLESQAPYHPLNVWNNGETRSRFGGSVHGYSAPQGIYVHETSRQYVDIFGAFVHVTFEIFDNRRNVPSEHRKYRVEIRDGSSHKRALLRTQYEEPGVYSERFYIRFGPGYYGLHVLLTTSHGLVYEDVFHIGYNVQYMNGFGLLIWLPLVFFSTIIVVYGSKRRDGSDESLLGSLGDDDTRGRSLPT